MFCEVEDYLMPLIEGAAMLSTLLWTTLVFVASFVPSQVLGVHLK